MTVRRRTITKNQENITEEQQAKIDYYRNDESLRMEKEATEGPETKYYGPGKGVAQWMGKLKDDLNLSNEITREDFNAVAYGHSPDGSHDLRKRSAVPNGSEERLFHDFCFSPNKSISIAGLVLGHQELIDAHNESIEEIAQYIEEKYGAYRQRGGQSDLMHGDCAVIRTGKMLFGALTHYTARPVSVEEGNAVDPQLHTHLLIMNTTQRSDGEWRGLFHELMSADSSLGNLYNQKMAQKTQALGFEIRKVKDGFELADISDEQIKIFSKRTNQAREKLKADGKEILKGDIHKQTLRTRKKKIKDLSVDDLRDHWTPQAEGMKVTKHESVQAIGYGSADEELEIAINHHSERCVKFSEVELKKYVFAQVQRFSVEEFEQAIAGRPDLIKLPRGQYTTPALAKVEIDILKKWGAGIGKVAPLIESVPLENLQKARGFNQNGEPIQLNENQAIAVKNVLESKDQFQVIQGLAGVGKTTAMAELLAQIEENGQEVELFGFASTHEAKSELEASLNLKSRTVASLVSSGGEGRVWIVDESGMNSNREWQDVLNRATDQGVRVIMVGDPNQNSSVEAGSPLAAVISKHPSTVQRMTKIIRQKDKKQLNAVELISAGRGAEAIKLLTKAGKVHEVEDRQGRAKKIVDLFMAKSHKDRKRTILVSGTNLERNAITETLRAALKTDGTLGDEVVLRNLISKNLSDTESKLARSFDKGDYVKFYNSPRSSHFKTANLYKIVEIKDDVLHLETSGGKRYIVAPSKFKGRIEGLREEKMEVAVGDRIKFTATVKNKDWYNGTQLDVVGVSGNWIKGKDKDGKIHKIDTHEPVGITHDWVGTSYGRQGKTARFAIASLTNDPTSARESSTVTISRQTHDIQVVTENFDDLLEWVQCSNRQPNLLDELGNSDRTITAIENAIRRFERDGSKAQAMLEQELAAIIKPKPTTIKAFWKVEYNDELRPGGPKDPDWEYRLEAHHWQEMKKSGIHPDLIKLNIKSIQGQSVIENLLEDAPERTKNGRYVRAGFARKAAKYTELEKGGWWGTAGTDAKSLLTDRPIPSPNGVFKGDTHRIIDGKEVKYENRANSDRPIFLANMPEWLANKIYEKHGINPTQEERDKGFWSIVRDKNLPVVLVEGQKKALSSLSQGVITIGTPGVALYQANEKINGKKEKLARRQLLADIEVFATPGREITLANDQDSPTKTKTVWNVRRDTVRTAELLEERSCKVKIAKWDPNSKGADDLIVNVGPVAYLKSLNQAKGWREEGRIWYKAQYTNISKEVIATMPNARPERVDLEVYTRAIKGDGVHSSGGDILDGDRIVAMSPHAKTYGAGYVEAIANLYHLSRQITPGKDADALLSQAFAKQINICQEEELEEELQKI